MPTLSTGTYDSICSFTLNSTQNIITFGNLPMSYDEFIVTLSGPYSGAAVYYTRYTSGTYYGQYDPSSYTYQYIVQTPTTGTAGYGVSAATSKGFVNLSSGTTTTHTTLELNINLHTQNNRISPVIANARQYATTTEGYGGLGTTAYRADGFLNNSFMLWWDSGGWGAGTVINLYGLRSSSLKAQGGNWITSFNGYVYHLFTSSGTFTPVNNMSPEILVVAGGGAGGFGKGGGGGAGGLVYHSGKSLTGGTSYTVTIGAGGAFVDLFNGANGSNSVFHDITAIGGGGGGSDYTVGTTKNGSAGGSGGGASRDGTPGSATQGNSGGGTGYGFAGGAGSNGTNAIYGGGGGGGAGGVGGIPTTTGTRQAGAGGIGGTTWTSWFTNFPTLMGHSDTPAGGGGGSSYSSGNDVLGGNGGSNSGGNGASYNTTLITQKGFNAVANTGGGGGGGADGGNAGSGASGLVVVRYTI